MLLEKSSCPYGCHQSGIYFDLLQSTLKEHQLEDFPGQIYNIDETGMPLDPRPPSIIAKSGQKRWQSGKKEQIAVIGCGNPFGQSISPMVIFEGKYLNYEVPGTIYGMSERDGLIKSLFFFG